MYSCCPKSLMVSGCCPTSISIHKNMSRIVGNSDPGLRLLAQLCLAVIADFEPKLSMTECKRQIAQQLRLLASEVEQRQPPFHVSETGKGTPDIIPLINVPQSLREQWRTFRETSLETPLPTNNAFTDPITEFCPVTDHNTSVLQPSSGSGIDVSTEGSTDSSSVRS
jgi:hypothetical protein